MRFAPVLRWAYHIRRDRNDLRGRLASALEEIDQLRADLSVEKCRTRRWKAAALEMAPRVGPNTMGRLLMQAQSDEIADLPEASESFPRSLP